MAFEHLTTENGLSQNTVLAITRDSRGFMWFGTQMGLSRYDGYRFRPYKTNPADTTSLPGNYITALLTDRHHMLWIGSQDGLSRYNPNTDAFERIPARADAERPGRVGGLSNGHINCLYEDPSGTLWVGTANGLNRLTSRQRPRFSTWLTNAGPGRAASNIRTLCHTADGALWAGTADGLLRLTPKAGGGYTVQTFRHDPAQRNSLSDNYVTSLAIDGQQYLWVGTLNGGLNRYDPATGTFARFMPTGTYPTGLAHRFIRQIKTDRQGRLWVGTLEGLSLYDPVKQAFISYRHEASQPKSLSRNSIHSLFMDRQGLIWVGTYYGGVNVSYPHRTEFTVYRNRTDRNSLSDDVVSSITEGRSDEGEKTLWIGTEGGGLNRLNRKTGQFTVYKHDPTNSTSIGSNLVKVVYRDRRGTIWAGTHGGGLSWLNPDGQTFGRFLFNEADARSLNAEVLSLLETRSGRFWIGTQSGLQVFRSTQVPLIAYPSEVVAQVGTTQTKALLETTDSTIWIGTRAGLHVDGPRAVVPSRLIAQSPLRSANINCLWQDRRGRVWIGTAYHGVSVYDPRTQTIQTFTTANGLPDNDVAGVLDDDTGALWISTANGLSRFDAAGDPVVGRTFINYSGSDGLASNGFNYNATCKTSTGELFFGSFQGITAFYPHQISISHEQLPVVFTDLHLFNKPVGINGADRVLQQAISQTPSLTLRHDQNVFSLDFALLNFVKPGKNRYAWRLDGFDQEWTYSATPSATYMNLPAGPYTFRLKGASNDGVWSQPIQLPIRVLPPIWQTAWAYLLYAALVAGAIFFVIRFVVLRALLRRDHELHQLKLNFFTNISHEIRTHLTLIAGPVERLRLARRGDPLVQQQLGYVQTDADRLLRLVTELMDFRRAESNHLPLRVAGHDLVGFLNEIYLFFQETARAKHITVSFHPEADSLTAWFDRDQLEKVLFNLLSNAVKFTPRDGQITLTVGRQVDTIYIRVIDNGPGIAPQYLPNLFSNYFQVNDQGVQNTGYGIGLALSKAIVELHKGSLTVKSEVAPGIDSPNRTCFTVALRIGHSHLAQYLAPPIAPGREVLGQVRVKVTDSPSTALSEPMPETSFAPLVAPIPESIPIGADGDAVPPISPVYTILLVEDNPAVRVFIRDTLSGRYSLTECATGKAGWEAAIEQIPDLIISDVTMPEMDGLILCNHLKTDERTSHIPVILLTARTTIDNQVSGLALGADCYLTKPFSVQVLELHVRNLLATREQMRQRFSRNILLQPQNILVSSVDEQFLAKVTQCLEVHLDNADLDVDCLAKEVGMSRAVLYKKLKALTDMSVNEFIKSFRLQRSAQLLEQKKLTVYEVAYAVGFTDRKYFSKEFKKQFGKTPTEFTELSLTP